MAVFGENSFFVRGGGSMWQADRRLWLTADRSRVVEDGDPEAAYLLAAGAGDEVPAEEAKRLGLMGVVAAASVGPEEEDEAEAPKRKPRTSAPKNKQMSIEDEENK